MKATVAFGKDDNCEEIQRNLSGIAGIVNGKMHLTDLHKRVDIFFQQWQVSNCTEFVNKLIAFWNAG